MRITKKLMVLVGSIALAGQFAQAADGSKAGKYVSVTTQRNAIVECKYELGRGGWPTMQATYVETPYGGQTHMRILPGQRVTAEDAKWINACADQKLGRKSGAVPAKPEPRPSGFCPKHAPVMYGGSRYCIKSQ